MNEQQKAILKLKAERQAVILAHNYVAGELQDVADFVGDSLQLSIEAARNGAPVIVVCGVRFMAETAKLLSPQAKVVLANSAAGCPMADMVDAATLRAYRQKHPQTVIVAYVNTTAEVKAEVDICCTSGNADKVVASLGKEREIYFVPDRNLGCNICRRLGRDMVLYDGCCPYHDAVTPDMIQKMKQLYPDYPVVVHPECPAETVLAADLALSTGGMLKYMHDDAHMGFVVGTEQGILHRLRKENPQKTFIALEPAIRCRDMKKISLDDLEKALQTLQEEIILPDELMARAVLPIRRMIEIK